MKRKLLAFLLAVTMVCESVPVSATENTQRTENVSETETEEAASAQAETEAVSETQTQTQSEPESASEAQIQSEPESASEPQDTTGTESESSSESVAEMNSESETGTETETETETTTRTEKESETEEEAVYHADDFVKPYLLEREPVDIEATDIYAGLDDSLLTAAFPEKYDPRTDNPQLVTSVINRIHGETAGHVRRRQSRRLP